MDPRETASELEDGVAKLEDAMQRIDKLTTAKIASSIPSGKTLIILSGDISDVDGFYGLAKYAQSGADVMFVMNYPAYLSEKIKYDEPCIDNDPDPGLGYNYGLKAVEDATLQRFGAHAQFPAYKKLLGYFGDADPKRKFKAAVTELAFFMALEVWNETKYARKGSLYFCIGGVNSINPFHANSIKNELFVYAPVLAVNGFYSSLKCNVAEEGVIVNQQGHRVLLSTELRRYNNLFLDFSGSMAFFDVNWQVALHNIFAKIKACVVMGGVQTAEPPKTQPSIANVLNRFSCATMNQLYHPRNTAILFQFLFRNGIPTYVVSNNVVHDLATKDSNGKATNNGWLNFIGNNGCSTPTVVLLANAYYNSPYGAPRKAFDYYSALVLCELVKSRAVKSTPKNLCYDYNYGISLVDPSYKDFDLAVSRYRSSIGDLTPDTSTQAIPFAENRKRAFTNELNTMAKIRLYNSNSLSVRDVNFALDSSSVLRIIQ
jgi:hypothetical protein